MKSGYYKVGDEIYFISGRASGNKFINLYADEVKWSSLAYCFLPSVDYLMQGEYSEHNPMENDNV